MDKFKLKVRIEIVPIKDGQQTEEASHQAVDWVDEEAVEVISAQAATCIDDMEEVVLQKGYEVMRQALSRHLSEISKKGRPSMHGRPN